MALFWAEASKQLLQRQGRPTPNEYIQMQLDLLIGQTLQSMHAYNTRDLSTIAISMAKIMKKVDRGGLYNGSPEQTLRNVLIGCYNSKNKQFIFNEIAYASVPLLYDFDARCLSNLIYAFGLAGVITMVEDGSTFFDRVAEVAIPNLHQFKPQELSNMLWAFGKMKIPNCQLFEKAGDAIVQLDSLDKFKPQELSNILWAFATLEESHPKLFEKVANHIVQLNDLSDFWPQALSNIAWAYATAEESHLMLFRKLANHIVRLGNLNNFKPQDLSNTVWAYASAKESHPALFQKLSDTAIKRQNDFKSQELANFVWACATNRQIDRHLFSSLVPTVEANLSKCNAQELANIAWAYAVANVDAPSVFNDEFINACIEKEDEFELEALFQLHQWQLWQEELKSNVSLPPSLQKMCYNAFVSKVPEPSKLQDDVISQLSSMELELEEEVLTKSGYRLDALVEVNGERVGVEVDGPSHFLGRNPTGSTILKHRQVTTLDEIPIVSVPYWEWDKLNKNSEEKQQYLRSLLNA